MRSFLFAFLVAGLVLPGVAWAAAFSGLGVVDPDPGFPGDEFSRPTAISGDGRVVAGVAPSLLTPNPSAPFRWTAATGWQELGITGDRHRPTALSQDGAVIVGNGDFNNPGAAGTDSGFYWTQPTGVVALGDLGGPTASGLGSNATAVSADGTMIFGTSDSQAFNGGNGGSEAYRWTAGTGMLGLGFAGRPVDVSADGSVLVLPDRTWTSGGGFSFLDAPAGLDQRWSALAGNADASVLVGFGSNDPGCCSGPTEAVRWVSGTASALGDLPGGAMSSRALATSADGKVVVGTGTSASGAEAFVWDAPNGMRSLAAVLAAMGVDLTGWTLTSAVDISDDGRTIVGTGINPSGGEEGWIATIPEPSTGLLLGSGLVAAVLARRVRRD